MGQIHVGAGNVMGQHVRERLGYESKREGLSVTVAHDMAGKYECLRCPVTS